jgi:4,5-DOPA dioxygenase extradiol
MEFDEWLFRKITEGEQDELLNYRHLAPRARLAHPTDEQPLPLFVALGAGSNGEGNPGVRVLHRGLTEGSLSMAACSFGPGV